MTMNIDRENLTTLNTILEDWTAASVWSLAFWAGASTPNQNSDGHFFLLHIRDAVVEDVQGYEFDESPDADALEEYLNDLAHERVDSMPELIYTWTTRAVFTDLDLWDEEDELGGGTMDEQVTHIAYQVGVRLYCAIARHLAGVLAEVLGEAEEFRNDVASILGNNSFDEKAEEVDEWDIWKALHQRREYDEDPRDCAQDLVGLEYYLV